MAIVHGKQPNLAAAREIKLVLYTNPTATALTGYRTMIPGAAVAEKLNGGMDDGLVRIIDVGTWLVIPHWAESYGADPADVKVWHKISPDANKVEPIIIYDVPPSPAPPDGGGGDEDDDDQDHKEEVTGLTPIEAYVESDECRSLFEMGDAAMMLAPWGGHQFFIDTDGTLHASLAVQFDDQILTDYTETDPNNRVLAEKYKATVTDANDNEPWYLYKDMGADYFDELDITFSICLTAAGGGVAQVGHVCLSSTFGDMTAHEDGAVHVYLKSDGKIYFEDGDGTASASWAVTPGNTYFVRITRPAGDDEIHFRIYTDTWYSTLYQQAWITSADWLNKKWRYVYAAVSNNNGTPGGALDSWVKNINFEHAGKIRHYESADSGTTWDYENVNTSDTEEAVYSGVTIDKDNNIHYIWCLRDGHVYYRKKIASGTTQDLTRFTEVDPNATLAVTAEKVTAADITQNESAHIYYDKGADHFDAIDIDFTLQFNGSDAGVDIYCGTVGISNTLDTVDAFAATDIMAGISHHMAPADSAYIWLMRGPWTSVQSYAISDSTPYYCTLRRAAGADVVYLYIYSDATRTTLLDTLETAGHGATKYQYLYTGNTWDNTINNKISFQIEDVCTNESEWWDIETIANNGNMQYEPDIVVDNDGDVHVVFNGSGWGVNAAFDNVQYRKRTSAGWGVQEAVSDLACLNWYAVVEVDRDNDPHVIWTGVNVHGAGLNAILYRSRGAVAWDAIEDATSDYVLKDNYANYNMIIDEDDIVHILYGARDAANNPQMVYRTRTDAWQSAEWVTSGAYGKAGGQMSIDLTGDVHCVWAEDYPLNTNPTALIYKVRSFLEDTWSAGEVLADDTYPMRAPRAIYSMWETRDPSVSRFQQYFGIIYVEFTEDAGRGNHGKVKMYLHPKAVAGAIDNPVADDPDDPTDDPFTTETYRFRQRGVICRQKINHGKVTPYAIG